MFLDWERFLEGWFFKRLPRLVQTDAVLAPYCFCRMVRSLNNTKGIYREGRCGYLKYLVHLFMETVSLT